MVRPLRHVHRKGRKPNVKLRLGEFDRRGGSLLIARGMGVGAFAEGDPRIVARLVLALIVSVWRWYRPEATCPSNRSSSWCARPPSS
ncbi:hypothetical protein [Rhodococcus opacus]